MPEYFIPDRRPGDPGYVKPEDKVKYYAVFITTEEYCLPEINILSAATLEDLVMLIPQEVSGKVFVTTQEPAQYTIGKRLVKVG